MKYNLISENGDEKQEIVKISSIKLKKKINAIKISVFFIFPIYKG